MKTGLFTQAEYDRMNEEISSLGVTVTTYYNQNIDRLGCIKLASFITAIGRARVRASSSQNSVQAVPVVELTKADLAAVKVRPVANKNIKGEAAMVNISYGQVTFEVNSDNAPKLKVKQRWSISAMGRSPLRSTLTTPLNSLQIPYFLCTTVSEQDKEWGYEYRFF